jgi:hypothetical protein
MPTQKNAFIKPKTSDPERMTPIEAMLLLSELKRLVK